MGVFWTKVIVCIAIYLAGIVTGMYLSSQIEDDINKRIK